MDIELKHTWRISRTAWYIRLYLWLWDANPDDITFCKLWWAYVFILPAFLVMMVFLTARSIIFVGKLVVRGITLLLGCLLVPLDLTYDAARLTLTPFKVLRWLLRPTPVAQVSPVPEAPKKVENPRSWGVRDVDLDLFTKRRRAHLDKPRHMPLPTLPKVERKPSVMSRGLEHIETGAAWSGMRVRELAFATKTASRPVKRASVTVAQSMGVGIDTAAAFAWHALLKPAGLALRRPVTLGLDVAEWVGQWIGKGVNGFLGHIVAPFARGLWWALKRSARGMVAILLPLASVLLLIGRSKLLIPTLVMGVVIGSAVISGYLFLRWFADVNWTGVGNTLGSIPVLIGTAIASLAVTIAHFVVVLTTHGAPDAGHAVLVGLWSAAPYIGMVVGGIVGALVISWLTTHVIATKVAPVFYNHLFVPVAHGGKTGALAVKNSTVGFGKIMLLGFKSVKSNTCPRVEIED